MGDAKRRRDALAKLPNEHLLGQIAQALSQTVGAVTLSHGADCTMYAAVGAKVLQELGHPAQMVIGSAAWRVGPGDGDVISHALEINQPGSAMFAPSNPEAADLPAGMFHAWIELGDFILDFTTGTLPEKAASLDAADGGHTRVDFHPDFLWVDKRRRATFQQVVNGYDVGIFNYVRHEKMERDIIEKHVAHVDLGRPTQVALLALRALQAGNEVRVVGVDESGHQTLESVKSNMKGLRPI